jgi:hypothetical protein
LELENMPNETRLANINNETTSKRWIMSTLEDFFIFTIRFKTPSFIHFVDIKGNSTYKVDLIFKDLNQKFLCEYSVDFDEPDDSKILDIGKHPCAWFVDVKLLNNTKNKMKMGLGYLVFKGRCEAVEGFEGQSVVGGKSLVGGKSVASQKSKAQHQEIVLELDSGAMVPEIKPTDMYFDNEDEPFSTLPASQPNFLSTQAIEPSFTPNTQHINLDS